MIPEEVLESFILEKSLKNNNLQKQPSTQITHASQPVKKCDAKCDARTKKRLFLDLSGNMRV